MEKPKMAKDRAAVAKTRRWYALCSLQSPTMARSFPHEGTMNTPRGNPITPTRGRQVPLQETPQRTLGHRRHSLRSLTYE